MIVTKIIGGLGNQMFQYAAGRALALRRKTGLRLDVSGYESGGLRQYELPRIFSCQPAIATPSDVRKILGWYASPALRKMATRLGAPFFRSNKLIIEPHFNYWSGINEAPPDCYLSGYWQSEKYFQEASREIRADFTFNLPMSERNAGLASAIAGVNAVSLHIRRGDYANNPHTRSVHGLCSLEYYQAAITHISERVDKPHFFIFSDDMGWVKSHLKTVYPCQYVEHNQGNESYNDMRLMSLCGHHIIANSSFSWWGAWLNPDPRKIVVAPKLWFANGAAVDDLLPPEWVAL